MSIDLALPCISPSEIPLDQLTKYLATIEQATGEKVNLIIVLDGPPVPLQSEWVMECQNRFGPHFSLHVFAKNYGKGAAIKAAANYFRGRYHFFLDADLPYDPNNLLAMLRELERGADLVIGKRNESYFQQLTMFRKFISYMFRWIFVHFFGFPHADTQAGIKGLSPAGKNILLQVFLRRYLFDLELVGRILDQNLILASVSVHTRPGIKPTQFHSKVIGKEIFDVLKVLSRRHWSILFSALLSCWLMFSTFSYDSNSHTMWIKSKAYSDFAAHIPFIKSLSEGKNFFPMEYPLFSGESNRYHFLFYLFVASMEKTGIPIDWALNGLSSLSLFFLCLMLYRWAYQLFGKLSIANLTLVFFWFNATFNWEKYFRLQGITWESILKIFSLREFVAFGPWDGSIVSAFWSLNILSNQRHLALPLGLFFLFLNQVYWIYFRQKKSFSKAGIIIWGLVIGLYPLLHQPTLIFYAILLSWLFLVSKQRKDFFWIGALALIMVVANTHFFLGISPTTIAIQLHPGYLATEGHWPWWKYWVWNLGAHFWLVPLGAMFFFKKLKIIVPFFLMFVLGNLFQFSREMAANHKFFNLFLMGVLPFSAAVIVSAQHLVHHLAHWYQRRACQLALAGSVVLTIGGGIMDFFPLWHDQAIMVPARSDAQTVEWIRAHTPLKAVFVSNRSLYHPASLAGRLLYLGHGYFPWSAGYDTYRRAAVLQEIFAANDFSGLCPLLQREKIDYLSYFPEPDQGLPKRELAAIKGKLIPDYENPLDSSLVYSRATICRSELARP